MRSTGLADGVEQQQRRGGRPDIGGGAHKLLGLLQRRHEHGRALVIILDRSGRPSCVRTRIRCHASTARTIRLTDCCYSPTSRSLAGIPSALASLMIVSRPGLRRPRSMRLTSVG